MKGHIGFAKKLSISLALSLVLLAGSAGCAGNSNTDLADSVQEKMSDMPATDVSSDSADKPSQAVSTDDASEKEQVVAEKIDDNGKPIWDFDEFVNGEWKREQEAKNVGNVYSWSETQADIRAGVIDIMQNTDRSSLSEDDGLYKVLTIYQQLADTSDNAARLESAKVYLSKVEEAKTPEDLYVLYRDERYALINDLMLFSVESDEHGYISIYLEPNDPWEGNEVFFDEDGAGMVFFAVMGDLGYSKERTREIAENTKTVMRKIGEYWKGIPEDEMFYKTKKQNLVDEGISVPFIDILGDRYASFCPKGFNPKLDGFYAIKSSLNFFDELYVPENLQMIKDYHLACAMYNLGTAFDPERYIEYYDTDAEKIAMGVAALYAEELLVREYMARNIESAVIDECEAMMEEVKETARTIIADADWLSVHGKEQARSKIVRMRESFGGDTAVNDFSDVELTDDTFENFISLCVSKDKFIKSQTVNEDEERELFHIDDYAVNAYYVGEYNAIVFTVGWLKNFQDAGCETEEEKLGFAGETFAHEISHAYDPSGSLYDRFGYYEPWMTEEEEAVYKERTGKIAEFFDGRETEYGKTIDGELIKDETFADLMAVECCLRILAKKDNPDYDAFFRAYAEQRVAYYTEEGMEQDILDPHLPAKDRINLVLGQFDKFYEIYDIDESSPYYVKESDRLPVF